MQDTAEHESIGFAKKTDMRSLPIRKCHLSPATCSILDTLLSLSQLAKSQCVRSSSSVSCPVGLQLEQLAVISQPPNEEATTSREKQKFIR